MVSSSAVVVVAVVASGVSTLLGVGGAISGANVSLPDELNDAHELNVSSETTIQRYMWSRL